MDTIEYDGMLPLGSMIRLKGEQSKYMIIGRGVVGTDKKLWDYALVEYPYGLVSSFQCIFCSDDMVEEVITEGYEDEQGKAVGDLIMDVKAKKVDREEFERRLTEIREFEDPALSS